MPLARLQIGLLMPDRTMAEAAGPVLEDRLDSMRTGSSSMRSPEVNDRPYADLFPERQVRVSRGEPVVLVDLGLGEGIGRDVLFDLWSERNLTLLDPRVVGRTPVRHGGAQHSAPQSQGR